jgi:hypothetical protein
MHADKLIRTQQKETKEVQIYKKDGYVTHTSLTGHTYSIALLRLDGKPKATNTTGLTGQIIISVAIGLVGFLTFCVLRTRWIVMFAPRTKLQRYIT